MGKKDKEKRRSRKSTGDGASSTPPLADRRARAPTVASTRPSISERGRQRSRSFSELDHDAMQERARMYAQLGGGHAEAESARIERPSSPVGPPRVAHSMREPMGGSGGGGGGGGGGSKKRHSVHNKKDTRTRTEPIRPSPYALKGSTVMSQVREAKKERMLALGVDDEEEDEDDEAAAAERAANALLDADSPRSPRGHRSLFRPDWRAILVTPHVLDNLKLDNFTLGSIRALCRYTLRNEELLFQRMRFRALHWERAVRGNKFLMLVVTQAYAVNLSMTGTTDVSPFKRVTVLDMSGCRELSNIKPLIDVKTFSGIGCRKLMDVAPLANAVRVDLTRSGVRDVSMLGNVKYLDLSFTSVSDVSALGNVYTLKLVGCINVRDVSKLGRVHELVLYGCNNVTDVSGLGQNYTLNLYGCYKVLDVSNLKDVVNLDLSFCAGVRDLSAFKKSKFQKLNLTGCSNIEDVSMLGGCHWLDLTDCVRVTSVEGLGNVERLELVGCRHIRSLKPVKNVKRLSPP